MGNEPCWHMWEEVGVGISSKFKFWCFKAMCDSGWIYMCIRIWPKYMLHLTLLMSLKTYLYLHGAALWYRPWWRRGWLVSAVFSSEITPIPEENGFKKCQLLLWKGFLFRKRWCHKGTGPRHYAEWGTKQSIRGTPVEGSTGKFCTLCSFSCGDFL